VVEAHRHQLRRRRVCCSPSRQRRASLLIPQPAGDQRQLTHVRVGAHDAATATASVRVVSQGLAQPRGSALSTPMRFYRNTSASASPPAAALSEIPRCADGGLEGPGRAGGIGNVSVKQGAATKCSPTAEAAVPTPPGTDDGRCHRSDPTFSRFGGRNSAWSRPGRSTTAES
jgi:hypothetical protein